MKLRSKIWLAQLPLGFMLALVMLVSVFTISELGGHSYGIVSTNFRNVIAGERMKESIERLESAAFYTILGKQSRAQQVINRRLPQFENELAGVEESASEVGEQIALRRLKTLWRRYYLPLFRQFVADPEHATIDRYLEMLEPRYLDVKSAAEDLIMVNQNAMVRKSREAIQSASWTTLLSTRASLLALLAGLATTLWITSRLLRPLESLMQAANRLGEGDIEARATPAGGDELGQLAVEFNNMAEKIARYRRSKLGELFQAQLMSQAAIDSIPDAVLVFDTAGRVSGMNRAGRELMDVWHLPAGNPQGGAEPTVQSLLEPIKERILRGGGPHLPRSFDEALRVSFSNGLRHLLPCAMPIASPEKGIFGVTVVLQDVTRLLNFDELRNDVVATVAHQFRTPLTSLRMAIHLCVEETAGPISPAQRDLLEASRQDCERLQSIVEDLLDLARLQAGKVEMERSPVGVLELVRGALDAHQDQARAAHVQLDSQVLPSASAVDINRERVQLVFDNLIANAIRYSPKGGLVTVRAQPDGAGMVRFEVIDTGEGIPAEHRERVFDRFYRVPGSRGGSAGLGLSIAREIVLAHGGAIGVQSREGQGSTFWFTMPQAGTETHSS